MRFPARDAEGASDSGGKAYVQDLIRQRAKEVWDVLASNGIVYVAGRRVGMPSGVREALEFVVGQ